MKSLQSEKEIIIKYLNQKYLNLNSLESSNIPDFKVDFEISKDLNHADLVLNTAMIYAKSLSTSPIALATEIVEDLNINLKKQNLNNFEKIEIKAPGFVNIFLSKNFIRESFLEINLDLDNKSKSTRNIVNTKFTDKNVLVEHSSPNLFKPFHIGHLMNNFIGEFIVRAMRVTGANVSTTSFPSDISLGIAKAIYIMKESNLYTGEINTKSNTEWTRILGQAYIDGTNLYKKFEEDKDEEGVRAIKDIANNLYSSLENGADNLDFQIYSWAKRINMSNLYGNLEKLGSNFDTFIFESESGIEGKSVVLENTGELTENKIFKKSEGAIVYIPDEGRADINTTVFINSDNNPTYAAKDIGLFKLKFSKFNPDVSIMVTDSEQIPHFKVVLDAAGKIEKKWQDNSHHITHGRMTLRGAKMSSRLGGVPTADEMIKLVSDVVVDKSQDKIKNLSEEERRIVQKDIALAALRISILRSKPGLNIDFDPDRATSFEGDSGAYLCYTHARCASLINKAAEQNLIPKESADKNLINLERKLFQFETILIDTIENISPQKLVTYLFELSQEFNSFYSSNTIINEDRLLSEHRLYIVNELKKVLYRSLYILGINAPEQM